MRKIPSLVGVIVGCMAGAALAQPGSDSSFLRPERNQTITCDTRLPSKVPIRCWVGQQFLVLPQDPHLRSFGYVEFGQGSGLEPASYDELAGKTVTVTNVEWETKQQWYAETDADADWKQKTWNRLSRLLGPAWWAITVKADDTGAVYTVRPRTLDAASSDDVVVDTLALVRDLQAARNAYLGHTYWILRTWLPQLGENGAIEPAGPVPFKQYLPVTVSDVLAGYTAEHPVRIVVKNAAGQEGYFDIAISPTNVKDAGDLKVGDAALEQVLASADLKSKRKWPAKIWAAIEDGNVLLGMTAEQARFSWHQPNDISRAELEKGIVRERWTYSDHRYIDLKNGIVTEVQNNEVQN